MQYTRIDYCNDDKILTFWKDGNKVRARRLAILGLWRRADMSIFNKKE